jgi:hypothetical protein
MAGSRRTFATSAPPSEACSLVAGGPVALAAVFELAQQRVTITFDRCLEDRVFVNLNAWFVRALGNEHDVVSGSSTSSRVTLGTGNLQFDPGLDEVAYTPPPNNVRSLADGAFAPPFVLPLTVV